MKAAGALLIFAAATYASAISLVREKRIISQLSKCCSALEIISAEVDRLASTDTMIDRLHESPALREFADALQNSSAGSFEDRWTEACSSVFYELRTQELRELNALAGFIGRYERSRELEALRHVKLYFDDALASARHNAVQKRRTSIGLYTAVGALLIIILL